MPSERLSGISQGFLRLSLSWGQIVYVLLTRSPLSIVGLPTRSVRLACIRHAASVHPEPGSNSPFDINSFFVFLFLHLRAIRNFFITQFLDVVSVCFSKNDSRTLFKALYYSINFD
jgi:hypothetical protein